LASEQVLNVTENVAEVLPEYGDLDRFTEKLSNTGESSEQLAHETSEISQVMSDQDAFTFAATGVGYLESLSGMYVGVEVTIPEPQKEEVASKAAVVIKKHLGGAEIPPWLKKYKEEIDLGLALGAFAFSVYRQKKAFDIEQEGEQGETKSQVIAKPVTDEVANDVYDYKMSEAINGN
jgi:hypothetical protein